MATAITIILLWLIVPGIMVSVFFFSIAIVSKTSHPEFKTSAKAGLWAGLILFIVYVISQLYSLKDPTFELKKFPDFGFVTMLIGFGLGFSFLWAIKYLVPTRLVGLITLILASSSSSALFSYIFIESIRTKIIFLSLGAAFGALLHIVFSPSSVREIWQNYQEKP